MIQNKNDSTSKSITAGWLKIQSTEFTQLAALNKPRKYVSTASALTTFNVAQVILSGVRITDPAAKDCTQSKTATKTAATKTKKLKIRKSARILISIRLLIVPNLLIARQSWLRALEIGCVCRCGNGVFGKACFTRSQKTVRKRLINSE